MRTITIIFGIIGAVLALSTVAIAILNYLLQKHNLADVGTDLDGIELSPQRSAHEPGNATLSPSYAPRYCAVYHVHPIVQKCLLGRPTYQRHP